ncbi:hypothetical protein [Oerskovia enterophila]|uniref:Uncharacterized protein n=1 Tax=Oerskovia enterophila TaxID=43678 RepID=A0ABX2YAZ9_9CELL|nr:hypothetical protein [Oerskovia enterophila]OCI32904.1 hypothetical protein OERS_04960 [Oerskovia enterophila]
MTSTPEPAWTPFPQEPVARKFEAAWTVFASTCGQYLAPEATFQAWFAHYLISQFGIDRVAREPTLRIDTFMDSPWKAKLGKKGEVKLDAVVTRRAGVSLPHYAGAVRAADGTGLSNLEHLAVIAELKVGASLSQRLDHTEVARDIWKLSMLLDEFDVAHPGVEPPLAYACILDNHPRSPYSRTTLDARLERVRKHPNIEVLFASVTDRPAVSGPRGPGPAPRTMVAPPGRWDWVTAPDKGVIDPA